MSLELDILSMKIDFAIKQMQKEGIDLWLTYGHETGIISEPIIEEFTNGRSVVGQSAFLVTADGERIALMADYDSKLPAEELKWEVRPHSGGVAEPLKMLVAEIKPKTIALNFSPNDFRIANGLNAYDKTFLEQTLADYAPLDSTLSVIEPSYKPQKRFVSAENLIVSLRGAKTSEEIELIQKAIDETQKMYDDLAGELKPGISELQIAEILLNKMGDLNASQSWGDPCPIVRFGEHTCDEHAEPTIRKLKCGDLVTIDFGIKLNGYVSDLQKTWYVGRTVPPEIQKAFDIALAAKDAAFETMAPGVIGNDVDVASKTVIEKAGYTPGRFCTGHPIGRDCHEIGALLGPDNPGRYKRQTHMPLQENQVYAVEPMVQVKPLFGIGLEENVLITANGIKPLSKEQLEITCV